MAQTPEGRIKDWLRRELKKKYPTCWIYLAPGGRFGRAGVPDLICNIGGLFVAIEAKTDVGKLSRAQEYEISLIENANGITVVIYGKDIRKLNILFEHIDEKIRRLQREEIRS